MVQRYGGGMELLQHKLLVNGQILLYSGGDYSVPYKLDNYLFVGVAESVYLCLR